LALGGTFDYLHSGHLLLLTYSRLLTADNGELIVGITGEKMLQNKKDK
jgi:phosphopantetheine adenylyltransferase